MTRNAKLHENGRRDRRDGGSTNGRHEAASPSRALAPSTTYTDTDGEPMTFREMVRRAEQGDRRVLPALREALDKPGAVDAMGGDLVGQIEQSLLERFAGKNLMLREALKKKLAELRAELAGPNPTPLEKLLADQVRVHWLRLNLFHAHHVQREDLTIELSGYYERIVNSAHRRLLLAIKTLASVRRLALPALQLNIGEKQVNINGAVVTPGKGKGSKRKQAGAERIE